MSLLDTISDSLLKTVRPNTSDNRIDRVDQCKILWYQWANELPTNPFSSFGFGSITPGSMSESELYASRRYDISNHIESVTFSKSMDSASGTFAISLANSFDWDEFMRPGQWICIFLNGEGKLPLPVEAQGVSSNLPGLIPAVPSTVSNGIAAGISAITGVTSTPVLPLPHGPQSITKLKPYLRCMGIIQRVSIKSITNVDGVVEESFIITGKDYGMIYEETEIWFNANNAESSQFQNYFSSASPNVSRNIGKLLDLWHDIFLEPGKLIASLGQDVNTFLPEQWILPDQLRQDFELIVDGPFFGNITNLKEFNATLFENPDPDPLAGLQGMAWPRLKNLSQPEFHELFTEISDAGNPKLIFRPIPWAMDTSNYPTLGSLMLKYSDLAGGHAEPPVAIGALGSDLTSIATSALKSAVGLGDQSDIRNNHAVILRPQEVESYDVGPDSHNRYNFFLVDSMKSIWDQQNAFALVSQIHKFPFPFRNEDDIKRYGFKPLFVSLLSFRIANQNLFSSIGGSKVSDDINANFMLEANQLLKDFYANAEDFYSGTMTLAGGKNGIKLGKVVVTSPDFRKIGNMVYYIDGYTDIFSVNGDGVTNWTQNLQLTRGIYKSVLSGASSKDIPPSKVETFQVFDDGSKSSPSLLDTAISTVKSLI